MRRLALFFFLLLAACRESTQPEPRAIGDPARGKELITNNGCTICHAIPGIEGQRGAIGPTLEGVGSRATITEAKVPNSPETLVRFLENPASVNPNSSMPPPGLAPGQANDVAAYLMTLK